jgi:hypothetical protein
VRLRKGLVAGLTAGAVAAAIWGVSLYRQGQANLSACGDLEPGGQRSDLIRVLGVPWSTKANPAKTRLVLTFPGSLFPMKPVRAVMNVRDDVVMEVDCGDGRIKTYDKY